MKRKRDGVVSAFLRLPRNARVCIGAEPLNTVPYNMYRPYFSRFMQVGGMTNPQIGLIGAISMAVHMLSAFLSTILVDRLGRKRATVIVDLLGWVIPCAVWAVSQSFAAFVIGTVFGALWRISNNAWNCLIIEEAEPEQMTPIFSWLNAVGQAAVFVTPVAGLIVGHLGLAAGMRILLWISFAMMLSRVVILAVACRETARGEAMRAASRGKGAPAILRETLGGLRIIFRSPGMLVTTLFVLLIYSNKLLYDTWFPMLIVEGVGLPDAAIAWFTVVRAAASLGCVALLSSPLKRLGGAPRLTAGIAAGIACYIAMTVLPRGSWAGVAVSFVLQGAMLALLDPAVNAMLAVHAPPAERARVIGLVWMVVHALCVPMAYALGLLSEIDPRAPFWATAALFAAGGVVALVTRRRLRRDEAAVMEKGWREG